MLNTLIHMMCPRKLLFLWVVLVGGFLDHSVQAQPIRKPLRVLTTRDGLPQSFVSGLVQDADGFVWLGTRNGLARYDGRQFTTFHYQQGDTTTLSSDVIISMIKDARGKIWIEHESGEIDNLNPSTQRIERISQHPLFRRQPKHFIRRGWMVDVQGNLWGTQLYGGVWCYDWVNQRVRHYTPQTHGLPSDTIRGLLASRKGSVWMISRNELSQFNPKTGQIQPIQLPTPIDVAHLSNQTGGTVRLHERPNGDVMWADGKQLNIFSPTTRQFRQVELPRFLDISLCWFCTGPDGEDYLTTYNHVYRYDSVRGLILIGELEKPSQSGESLLVDNAGLIWVGTNAAGIQQIDRSGPYFDSHPNQLGFQTDILQQLFGVSLEKTFDWPMTDHGFRLASYFVRSTYGADNQLWMGLRYRVGHYDSTRRQMLLLPTIPTYKASVDRFWGVSGLRFDPSGTLWVMDNEGYLAWFDTLRQKWVSWLSVMQLRKMVGWKVHAQDLIVDARAIWITTSANGLIRIDRTTKQTKVINQATPSAHFSSDLLLGMQPDPTRPNLLWIGSYEGLILLDKTTLQGRVFTIADGLPDNTIYSVLADDSGYLWLSTNKGLCRFQPRTHKVRTMNTADGLPGDEFNRFHHLRLPDGRLAFGGTEGWAIFDPKAIQNDHFQPPVALTELKINNQVVKPVPAEGFMPVPINSLDELRVPYQQNTISLSFAGLQYKQPSKLRYRYQLNGYDDDWVQAGFSPLATYTQLPEGRYSLRVNATNTTGQWSHHIRTLKITVQPPWWRTWWAYLVYFLIGIGLLRLYIGYRTKQEREQQIRLAQQREAEQLRIMDELKTRFFANITHEFRTPLTLILTPVETLLSELSQSRYGGRLSLIERNARQLLGLINQLMDMARLDANLMSVTRVLGRPDEVVAKIVETFTEAALVNHIQLIYQPEGIGMCWFDPEKLERIVTNLVANALKFSAGTPNQPGTVTVSLRSTDALYLSVADTGIGIAAEQLPHLFDRFYQVDTEIRHQQSGTGIGLALVKELVDLQGGHIRVESQPGLGTTFWVDLPCKPASDNQPVASIPVEVTPKIQPDDVQEAETVLLLLVEDNDDMAQFIMQSLPPSYQVHRAINGQDGLEQARQRIPDLIISDVMMPRMDGYQLCQQLKTDARTDHIPILLLTAKVSLDSRMEGLQQGADEYLSKPFHLPELLLRIHNLLTTQRRLRERLQASFSQPADVVKPAAIQPFLETLYKILDKHLDEVTFGVEELAAEANMSRMQLHRKLKVLTGLSTTEFMRTYRLQQSVALLAGGMPVSQVAYAVGFENPSYFGLCFREQFGQPPSQFVSRLS